MQPCRWVLALVIMLMLIDAGVKRAEAQPTAPTRPAASSRSTNHPIVPMPGDSH